MLEEQENGQTVKVVNNFHGQTQRKELGSSKTKWGTEQKIGCSASAERNKLGLISLSLSFCSHPSLGHPAAFLSSFRINIPSQQKLLLWCACLRISLKQYKQQFTLECSISISSTESCTDLYRSSYRNQLQLFLSPSLCHDMIAAIIHIHQY